MNKQKSTAARITKPKIHLQNSRPAPTLSRHWKSLARFAAATTAATAVSQGAVVQINLIGNSLAVGDKALDCDDTGGSRTISIIDIVTGRVSGTNNAKASVNATIAGVKCRAIHGASSDLETVFSSARVGSHVQTFTSFEGQSNHKPHAFVDALVPIQFSDAKFNNGKRTAGFVEIEAAGYPTEISLTRIVFDNSSTAAPSGVVAGGSNTVIGTTEQGFYARVKNDFTGDGSPDLIFQNKGTGEVMAWLLSGTTYRSTKAIGNVGKSAWQIVGTGVFSGNGQNDLLWQNSVTGEIVIWFLDGTKHISTHSVGKVADTAWKIVGTGVFSGSGKPDLVFQNTKTGQVEIWLMNGATHVSTKAVGTEADTDWKIVATGDIDGDGNTDLVFQNSSTSQIMVWYMDGTSYESSGTLEPVPGTGWSVVGAEDFNADGNTDLLLQNTTTGKVEIWLMNEGTYVSTVHIGTESDTHWQIKNR